MIAQPYLDKIAQLIALQSHLLIGSSTGGGLGVPGYLERVPGLSGLFLEWPISYDFSRTEAYLGRTPAGYVREDVAVGMANYFYLDGLRDASKRKELHKNVIAVGFTAGIATTRERRGDDHFWMAVRTNDGLYVAHITLEKGVGRERQIDVCNQVQLNAIFELSGIGQLNLVPGFEMSGDVECVAGNIYKVKLRKLECGQATAPTSVIQPDGTITGLEGLPAEKILYSGSFAPATFAHRDLARRAEEASGKQVVFEMTTHRFGKPSATLLELEERAMAFRGLAPVIISEAAAILFIEKMKLYGVTGFVIGADVMLKVTDAATYGGAQQRDAVLREFDRASAKFYVAPRRTDDGTRWIQVYRDVPREWWHLFEILQGNWEISSTEIRNARANGGANTSTPQPAAS